ncbi:MAG: LysR substrate-binding domain-containing protein [Psychromonas sp.]
MYHHIALNYVTTDHGYKHILNIRISQSYCHTWLLPRLADFHRNHPDIHLKFQTTTNTHPNIYPDINSGLDIEIINGYGDWQDLAVTKLTHNERWLVVASPSFIKQHDFSLPLEQIAYFPKIETSGYKEDWQQWFHSQRLGMPFSSAIFMFASTQLSIDAAIQGNGMLLAKSILVQDAIQQGDLIEVHQHQLQSSSNHYLVTNPNSNDHYKVKMFKQWLLSIAEE